MREYSNAFIERGLGIYNKFIEIFDSGIVYYDPQERRFIQTIREQYGLNVVFTELFLQHQRARIQIYVDFQGNTCAVANELNTILRKNEVVHLPLNNIIDQSSEALKVFVQDIEDTFLHIFNYKKTDLVEVNLYIDDFVRSFLARIHSTSLHDIRSYLKTTFGMTGIWRIVIGYEPSITIVADDTWKYQKLLLRKRKIVKDCYAIMKKQDHFDLLTEKDVHILILLKSNLDHDTVNRYARELV